MTILLIVHVIGMLASLLTTGYTLAATTLSQEVQSWLLRLNVAVTLVGLGSGGILLISRPLDFRCAVLTAYLAAFVAAYVYVKQKSAALSLEHR